MISTISVLPLLCLIILPALARTDLAGCTSSISGNSIIYAVPGTGELCQFLDCGGGRAPVKTTVPGCAAYAGTETYSPSYLAGYGPGFGPSTAAPATPTAAPVVTAAAGGGTTAPVAAGVLTAPVVAQSTGTTPIIKSLPPTTFATSAPTASATRSINGTISLSTLASNSTSRLSSTAAQSAANASSTTVLGSGAGREYPWGMVGVLVAIGGVVV